MLYRPLVLPKLATSRGQHIAPGFGVLATGGPKHRGKSITPNPHLLDSVTGWTSACAPEFGEGFLRLVNIPARQCNLLYRDTTVPLVNGKKYWVEFHVPILTAEVTVQVYVGETLVKEVTTPGVHVWTDILSEAISNRVLLFLNAVGASNSIMVTYFDVRELT